MKEILTIDVDLNEIFEVKGKKETERMILFGGSCDCELFKGVILPGGVDTQRQTDERTILSARYILKGTDSEGKECSLFIENNGVSENNSATTAIPRIVTDSSALAYLEEKDLVSQVEGKEGGVIIHIFEL